MNLQRQFESLEGRRVELFAKIEGLDESLLNRRPGEGRWSVIQVFCHLIKAEELSLAYIRNKIKDPSRLVGSGLAGALITDIDPVPALGAAIQGARPLGGGA